MPAVQPSPVGRRIAAMATVRLLDVLLVAGWAWSIAVLVTGGWDWRWRFGVVRAGTASTVIYVSAVLTFLRYGLAERLSDGVEGQGVFALQRRLDLLSTSLSRLLEQVSPATVRRLLWGIVLVSTLARLLNAWHYWGFCCGDDVEIHEMTFSRIFDLDWPIWNIRTAVYPMLFVYPFQAMAVRAGISDPALLVFAGRLAPIAFSAAAIWLTFHLAKHHSGTYGVALTAATVLAVSKVFGSFGSSELPGTVAAAFVLGGALLLLGNGFGSVLVASLFVGAAASFRFSELVFVAAGIVSLCAARRWWRAAAFGVLSLACFFLIVAASDFLFWGKPLSSLVHIVDFTLVQRLSSRGFEPFHYYLSSTPAWADWLFVAFLAFGAFRAPLQLSVWFLVPIAALSCLPHKEPRYLVPAMPFASILAAYGFWSLLADRPRRVSSVLSERFWRLLVVGGLCTALLLEADGFRFRRSEAAIRAVSSVARRERVSVVALERSWMAGRRLYLMQTPTVLELPEEALTSGEVLVHFLSDRQVDLVGLTDTSARRRGYDRFLTEHGFMEAGQESERLTYRVFWRPPGSGSCGRR